VTTGPVGQDRRPPVTGDRERQSTAVPPDIDPALLERGGVRFTVSGVVARLTLNRPHVHNAQLPATWDALRHIGSQVPSGTRVIVVDGVGPSFSAGLDTSAFDFRGGGLLSRIAAMNDADADAQIAEFQESFRWLATTDAASIAAVHGHAIGAGFQLALACEGDSE
jgi:enoyl-CoA hydratase/carnithine racemase